VLCPVGGPIDGLLVIRFAIRKTLDKQSRTSRQIPS
jgi:hypothetical protein